MRGWVGMAASRACRWAGSEWVGVRAAWVSEQVGYAGALVGGRVSVMGLSERV